MYKRGSWVSEHLGKLILLVVLLVVLGGIIILFSREMMDKLSWIKEILFFR